MAHHQACRWRVLICFGALAATVGSLAFVLTLRSEEATFAEQWSFQAQAIISTSAAKADAIFSSVSSIAALYPVASSDADVDSPFVNIKDFEVLAIAAREKTGIDMIAYAPMILDDSMREKWEVFTLANDEWIQESAPDIRDYIWQLDQDGSVVSSPRNSAPYAPLWQMSASSSDARSVVNMDLTTLPMITTMMQWTMQESEPVLSHPLDSALPALRVTDDESISILLQPVKDALGQSGSVVGHLLALVPWTAYFEDVLQAGQDGVRIVVESCGSNRTYEINGADAVYIGQGDHHDASLSGNVHSSSFANFGSPTDEEKAFFYCDHKIYVFPSVEIQAQYYNAVPAAFAGTIVGLFGLVALIFVGYDMYMSRPQTITEPMQKGEVNAIIPHAIQNVYECQRCLGKETDSVSSDGSTNESTQDASEQKAKDLPVKTLEDDKPIKQVESESLMDYVNQGVTKIDKTGKSIAELFPEATVLFADIAGFTAWSSIREPSQVFCLLESIFGAFDTVAVQMGVFKVETVGDCYVAVCGLPVPNANHAVVIAEFARACMEKANEVIRELELTLGPDTSELAIRVGIHSGQVTAGVLRGDRARFQLFGDTVNTAARIESTGKRNRIHLSEQAAMLIMAAGYKAWVIEREDAVEARGKGTMKTYWLMTLTSAPEAPAETTSGVDKGTTDADIAPKSSFMEKIKALKENRASKERRNQRLIQWNSELLIALLKKVYAHRQAEKKRSTSAVALRSMAQNIGSGLTVVEEVAEVIILPEFNAAIVDELQDIELPEGAAQQVHAYVAIVAGMYRDNCFHNFEHASHVTMSVSKLLHRIVAPKQDKELSDETYGITSDPLTQFSVVLSALIHDVDHRGVPNFLLCTEEPTMAAAYKSKSVAEQNSVDLAWNALMSDGFDELRSCIFGDIGELRRFRQLLVNSVIATDIFDKELGDARKARWNKAFSEELADSKSADDMNRKATIVIEHLIQASDVAHTMQHWHIYTKWNERLFEEMYKAYKDGRWEKDPTLTWVDGEIGFLTNYVIPLAKKLKDCGVFGVSSDEYLNYATENLREWKAKGHELVETFREKYCGVVRAVAVDEPLPLPLPIKAVTPDLLKEPAAASRLQPKLLDKSVHSDLLKEPVAASRLPRLPVKPVSEEPAAVSRVPLLIKPVVSELMEEEPSSFRFE